MLERVLSALRPAPTPALYNKLRPFDPAVRRSDPWVQVPTVRADLVRALEGRKTLAGEGYVATHGSTEHGFHVYGKCLQERAIKFTLTPAVAEDVGTLLFCSRTLGGLDIDRSVYFLHDPGAVQRRGAMALLSMISCGTVLPAQFAIRASRPYAVTTMHRALHPAHQEVQPGHKWWTWLPTVLEPFAQPIAGARAYFMKHSIDGQVQDYKPGLQSFAQALAMLQQAVTKPDPTAGNRHDFRLGPQNSKIPTEGQMHIAVSRDAHTFELAWGLPGASLWARAPEYTRQYADTPLIRGMQALHHDIFLRHKARW